MPAAASFTPAPTRSCIEFINKTDIPITTTLLGLGAFPSGHELWIGMPGMHGTYTANKAIQNGGSAHQHRRALRRPRDGKLAGFAPQAKIVHIDIDPAEIGKNVPTDIPIVGDVKTVLQIANSDAKHAAKADAWRAQLLASKRRSRSNIWIPKTS